MALAKDQRYRVTKLMKQYGKKPVMEGLLGVSQLVQKYVGRKGIIRTMEYSETRGKDGSLKRSASPGMLIAIEILEARVLWSKVHLLITPVSGTGSVWVHSKRVKVVDKWPHEETGPDEIGAAPLGVGSSPDDAEAGA